MEPGLSSLGRSQASGHLLCFSLASKSHSTPEKVESQMILGYQENPEENLTQFLC